MAKEPILLFTDGACSGNPGPGGWGAILQFGEHEKVLSGGEVATTNNRMELTAVINGLKALKYPCRVKVYTDSKYIVDAMVNGWAKGWRARGWKRSNKEDALNPDLWAQLLDLNDIHDIEFIWVKGHAGHPENERADSLAVLKRDEFSNNI